MQWCLTKHKENIAFTTYYWGCSDQEEPNGLVMQHAWHVKFIKMLIVKREEKRSKLEYNVRLIWILRRYSDGLRAGGRGFDSREGHNLSLPRGQQTASGAHPASYPVGRGSDLPGVKRPGREANHSYLVLRSRMVELYLHSLMYLAQGQLSPNMDLKDIWYRGGCEPSWVAEASVTQRRAVVDTVVIKRREFRDQQNGCHLLNKVAAPRSKLTPNCWAQGTPKIQQNGAKVCYSVQVMEPGYWAGTHRHRTEVGWVHLALGSYDGPLWSRQCTYRFEECLYQQNK
jgi:hypothetical protein